MRHSRPFYKFTAIFFALIVFSTLTFSTTNEIGIITENLMTASVVGENGSIMRTDNGGINWVQQYSNLTNVINSIDYVNYTNGQNQLVNLKLAVCENGVILRSTDNGNTWNIILSGTLADLNDIAINSPDMIFVCGNNGSLLRSTDMGLTWIPYRVKTSNNLNHLALLNPSLSLNTIRAIVVGDNGTCFATTNMNDWFRLNIPTTENILSISARDSIIVCGTDHGTTLRSVNRGNTWETIASGISNNIYELIFINSGVVVGSCENGTIIRSTDYGSNWVIINSPVKNDLFAIDFGSESFGIATGGFGTEIYTTDGGISWSTSPAAPFKKIAVNVPVKLEQNYPNPFNPSTKISYTIDQSSFVNIMVYDMTGREIKTLCNEYRSAGTYNVNFNATDLSSGIYFYTLRVNSAQNIITKTMKMILTK